VVHLYSPITIPALPAPEVSLLEAIFRAPLVKALLPIPVILAVAPAVYWFFKETWRELDEEARLARLEGKVDFQPHVALVLLAVTLTIHEYYGGRAFFNDAIFPYIVRLEEAGFPSIQSQKFRELYGYGYWVFVRVMAYMAIPIALWKILFPRESVLDMGLRVRGFFSHLGLYGLCLLVVFLAMAVVGRQADFATYYPFYQQASRSWFDLLVWEAIYFAQFFGLEFYFRGFLLHAFRRSMGSSAIFAMAVPYCMIHFGKPYLETHGAIIAGVVLGSLAMKTRSVYAGFLVHIAVAGAMDLMALTGRNGLPTRFWP
jgi:membrane protease YdiL (CAAX protease family)